MANNNASKATAAANNNASKASATANNNASKTAAATANNNASKTAAASKAATATANNNASKAAAAANNALLNKIKNNNLKDITIDQLPKIDEKPITVDGIYGKIDDISQRPNIYKYLAIGLVVIIVIVIIVYFWRNRKKQSEVKIFIEKQISSNKYTLDGDVITLPKNGYDYSMSFWFYIKDYYENYNQWRHVLHKGTVPNQQYIEHNKWDKLTQEIQEQSPGIWLHPNKNSLRLAFTIEVNKDFCSTNDFENTCIEKTYCVWDGLACNPKKQHAYTDMQETDYENIDKTIIEYIDIDNIPTKTMFFIAFTLKEKILEVYINGKLYKTKKFLGVPIFNKKDMNFNYKNTYGGIMYNYRYLPYSISSEKMLNYYNDIPNVDKFPKKYRIKKFASEFKIGKLFKTLTI